MELLYIIDGKINIKVEGKITELKSDDIYSVGHDRFHKTISSVPYENIKYLVVLFSYDKLLKYYPNQKQIEFNITQSDSVTQKIKYLLKQSADYYETRPVGYELKINSLMHDLYYTLISECV